MRSVSKAGMLESALHLVVKEDKENSNCKGSVWSMCLAAHGSPVRLVSSPWSSHGISWEDPCPKLGEVKEGVPWCLLPSIFWVSHLCTPWKMTVGGGTGNGGDCEEFWFRWVIFLQTI